jgi:hypothetical protein
MGPAWENGQTVTAAASEATLDVPVDVRFTPAGNPLAIRYNGRIWAVMADPLHWFARDSWSDTRRTSAVGSGDLVSVEYWRVQVGFIYPQSGFTAMRVLN